MRKQIVIFFSTAAYAGYFPVAPGTIGTLWGVVIWYLVSGLPGYVLWGVTLVVLVASVVVSGEAIKVFGSKDPSRVVCDEVCGLLISAFFLSFTAFNVILVFILFRFFDILKPYPAGAIDRRVPGGLGVVLDDVIAGAYANLSAHGVLWAVG